MASLPLLAKLQIEWANKGAGPGADTSGKGAGGKKSDSKTLVQQGAKAAKGNKSFLRSTLGIQLGVAAILKQSQIFTGIVGTIFQLVGALVDVILAPFLPIIVPAIRLIAKMIPVVANMSRKLFEFIEPALIKITGLFSGMPESIGGVFKNILAGIILVGFWAKVLGLWGPFIRVSKALLSAIDVALGSLIVTFIKMIGDTILGIGNIGINLTKGILVGLKTVWTNLIPDFAKSIGGSVAGSIKTVFTEALAPLTTAIDNVAGKLGAKGLFGGLKSLAGGAKGLLGGTVGKIMGKSAARAGLRGIPVVGDTLGAVFGFVEVGKALAKGDFKTAAKLAGATTAFTAAQIGLTLATPFSGGTLVAAKVALGVAEVVALEAIKPNDVNITVTTGQEMQVGVSGPASGPSNNIGTMETP